MHSGMIYTVHADGSLLRMPPGAPANEDRMQDLVAKYPELIGDDDGRLLLIRREHPIADGAGLSGRWAVDHLFVTPAGVPVLVEIKRAVDTRLRREVVGQLLEYAANCSVYWQAGTVAAAFAATYVASQQDPDAVLAEFLGDGDPDAFWAQVDANFAAGRLKLIFVADVIPRELARIVEFMNEQMRIEVRAIELKWFQNELGSTTLVPRIIGTTERAAAQKSTKSPLPPPVSVEQWIEGNIRRFGDDYVQGAYAFVGIINALGGEVVVAKLQGSIMGVFKTASGQPVYPLHLVREKAVITVSFNYLLRRPRLVSLDARQQIYDRFLQATGKLSTANLQGYPGFSGVLLTNSANKGPIQEAMRELVAAAIDE